MSWVSLEGSKISGHVSETVFKGTGAFQTVFYFHTVYEIHSVYTVKRPHMSVKWQVFVMQKNCFKTFLTFT